MSTFFQINLQNIETALSSLFTTFLLLVYVKKIEKLQIRTLFRQCESMILYDSTHKWHYDFVRSKSTFLFIQVFFLTITIFDGKLPVTSFKKRWTGKQLSWYVSFSFRLQFHSILDLHFNFLFQPFFSLSLGFLHLFSTDCFLIQPVSEWVLLIIGLIHTDEVYQIRQFCAYSW